MVQILASQQAGLSEPQKLGTPRTGARPLGEQWAFSSGQAQWHGRYRGQGAHFKRGGKRPRARQSALLRLELERPRRVLLVSSKSVRWRKFCAR